MKVNIIAILEHEGREYTVAVQLERMTGLERAREIVLTELLDSQGVELPGDCLIVFHEGGL